MDVLAVVSKELKIPKSYMKKSSASRTFLLVHCDWITSLLINNKIPAFIEHDNLSGDEIQALFFKKENLEDWHKLIINIVRKPSENENIIPLPRPRTIHSNRDSYLSFSQLLHYISETNFKNMWKHFYKTYTGKIPNKSREHLKECVYNKNTEILVEVIKRFYGCKIIYNNLANTNIFLPKYIQNDFEPHPNILPSLCIIETNTYFFILHYVQETITLKDCLTFSPSLLYSNYTKLLFVIYQLLQVMKNSHDKGLILGNLQLSDIFINDTLFIQIIPNLEENLCKLPNSECEMPENNLGELGKFQPFRSYSMHRPFNIFPSFPSDCSLQSICNKWINKEISNFDYLIYLNQIAGRRFGDPSCHFIMPWVTDFATRSNGNWRDLSKSKFRLNKGDRQLDLTYESAPNSNQIPHHVSDVLSEITYFVYLSRRTPRSVLCKYVRSVWVPGEYPSSIQRLQEWTPDECIPEFFYDPTIFKSIHEDLPNLELPHWALTPEEFIEAHRECLESKYVSEKLHHWIDLTFGYKLSGLAAIKSKNVCLHLVESHKNFKTSGVVQLFHYPHPTRLAQVQFYEKVPPKILLGSSVRQPRTSMVCSEKTIVGSEDEGQSSGNGEDDSFGAKSSPLVSRLITKSKGSLMASFQSTSIDDSPRCEQIKSGPMGVPTSAQTINIPKEFNPIGLLGSVETTQNFFRKTFLGGAEATRLTEKRNKFKQIIANKRIQEMQILGCLVIEMYLQSKIRVIEVSDLDRRINVCLNFLNHENLPRCLRSAVSLLLQPASDPHDCPYVTSYGLPSPSAHQLLQPLLSSFIFPFPKLFPTIYYAVCNLVSCSQEIAKQKLRNSPEHILGDALNILKIKKFNIDLDNIWEEILSSKSDGIVELLFPFIKELFDNPSTSKLSIILFLNKTCRSLGPKQTNELLLETILNLYNSNSYESFENLYRYHKKFLIILMVHFGLKVFLENFIGPLMEVVGRYKDSLNENWNTKHCSDRLDKDYDVEPDSRDLDLSPEMENSRKCNVQDLCVEVFPFERDDALFNSEFNDNAQEFTDFHLTLEKSMFEDVFLSPNIDQNKQSLEIGTPVSSKAYINLAELENEEKMFNHRQHLLDCVDVDFDSLDFSKVKASDIAGDSIIWLAHRLGPVLTSRHLTRNLLRMLSLCFTGKDNLEPRKFSKFEERKLWNLSVLKWRVVGDENVEMILRVLGEISEIYGEQIILLQYLPFMSELINISKKKFTQSVEGGLIGCLTLLEYIIPFLNDSTLMDQLPDVILKSIIHPVIRLVSSTRFAFPSEHAGRYTVVAKLIDCIYLISIRIGVEMTKAHIAVPALQRFFLAFDKAYGITTNYETGLHDQGDDSESINSLMRPASENTYLEIQRDGSTTEWSVRDKPGEPITFSHIFPQDLSDSSGGDVPTDSKIKNRFHSKIVSELKSVFDANLAYHCYKAFSHFLGEACLANALKNISFIQNLYHQYDQEKFQEGKFSDEYMRGPVGGSGISIEREIVGSFGSNVEVIGNKIEIRTEGSADSLGRFSEIDSNLSTLICREKKDSGRHLRGNWLAYWEHEIGRSDKDNGFNFKQIKLQNFNSHVNSVRMIHCLENENSFISGSKDKTVKLWSLRSQGEGNTVNGCQFTYSHHRKSLLSLSFIPTVRMVASCDSTIHLWDPFEGKTITIMDSAKVAPINVLKTLTPPSCNVAAATTDATLKIIDARLCSFVSEYKISNSSVGLIRSLCVSPNGNWIAVGQASGLLTVLDIRTGMVLSTWKGHEAEILQLAPVDDNVFMSSSLDQSVSVWNSSDGKFKFCMKGPAEPVHCLSVCNSELITGTTANRVGVHTSIDGQASFSSTKLRSDAFKGILTSMVVLPLNKLLLLGADNGNITLLC